jgi:hypothetical protein
MKELKASQDLWTIHDKGVELEPAQTLGYTGDRIRYLGGESISCLPITPVMYSYADDLLKGEANKVHA